MKDLVIQGDLSVQTSWKIGLVASRFNNPVTEKLEQGALSKLLELGLPREQVVLVRVPGAVEIPLAVQTLFEAQACDAVVTVGAVIRGETYHFESVCNSVERGCTEVQLRFNRPVGFGVIMTNTPEQAFARCGGAKGNKGAEASEVVVEMLNLKQKLKATN